MKDKKPIVFSLSHEKGGSGKTTASTNLAHGLSIRGYRVLLVDADPQGSSSNWNVKNNSSIVTCIGLATVAIKESLKGVYYGYDIVIIDSAPQKSKLTGAVISASDVVLIPVQPSPYDIDAAKDLVDIVNQRIEVSDGLCKAAFIISREIKKSNLSKSVIGKLSKYGLPILKSRVSQHIAYQTTVETGQTVFSSPKDNPQAYANFNLLVDEIIDTFIEPKQMPSEDLDLC